MLDLHSQHTARVRPNGGTIFVQVIISVMRLVVVGFAPPPEAYKTLRNLPLHFESYYDNA